MYMSRSSQLFRIIKCDITAHPITRLAERASPDDNIKMTKYSVFLGFLPDTPLNLYEEIKPDFVEKIANFNEPLEKVKLMIYIL